MSQWSGPEPEVAIRLLGGVDLRLDGRQVELGGERVRALLVVLALAVGEPLSTGVLADRVWGDEPPANIGPSLHTLMTRLRRSIGSDVVVTGPTGYSLRIDPDQVDALRFVSLLRAAAKQTDPQLEYAGIAEAVALWGRPFEGVRSDWLETVEAPRLTEQYLGAVERLVDLRPPDAPYGELLVELRQLAEQHPLRESLWVRLLRLLAQTGRGAEALELYESIRRRIADELGVDPGAELRNVHTALLSGEPAPERPLVPNQLPADVPGFTGRKEAVADLDRAYSERGGESAITVVLHGPGGAGKTSLAVHWSYRVASEFPDGVLFADLGGYGPGEPVEPAVALGYLLQSLGVQAGRIPADVEGRGALLRSMLATRRVLLVLDNVRNAEQVRPLLPGSGAVVLITSRSRLRGLAAREGARQIAVDQLSAVDARALLVGRIGVHDEDDVLLDQLAERCNHLPLALVIAAEQVATRSTAGLQELVEELDDRRLDVLDTGDDPATDLRAVFSWSYRALDDESARFFRLLSIHPARRFSAAGAAALAGITERTATRLLHRLTDLHLLGVAGTGRYQLHDLLRAYAGEQLRQVESEQDVDAAWERLLDWACHSTSNARLVLGEPNRLQYLREPLPGTVPLQFADRAAAQQWFDLELRPLMALVRHGAAAGHHRFAASLGLLMWGQLDRLVSAAEAIALHEIAVAAAARTGEQLLEAMAFNQLGTSYGSAGDLDRTETMLLQAMNRFLAIGSLTGEALVCGNLGFLYQLRGQHEQAIRYLERGIAINRETDEPQASTVAQLNNLAMTHLTLGRPTKAMEIATEAIELSQGLVNQRYLAISQDSLGQALSVLGRHAEAADMFELALVFKLAEGQLAGVANTYLRLALARFESGDVEGARAPAEQVRAMVAEHGVDRLKESGTNLEELLARLDQVERG